MIVIMIIMTIMRLIVKVILLLIIHIQVVVGRVAVTEAPFGTEL